VPARTRASWWLSVKVVTLEELAGLPDVNDVSLTCTTAAHLSFPHSVLAS